MHDLINVPLIDLPITRDVNSMVRGHRVSTANGSRADFRATSRHRRA